MSARASARAGGLLSLSAVCVFSAAAHAQTTAKATPRITVAEAQQVLAPLVESYGPSGMEAPVRQTVQRLLPAWAHTETDTAGNLWLKVGSGDPVVVFVAHTDEIGYRVSAIRDDGTLEIRPLGGFFPSLFEARPALVHTGGKPIYHHIPDMLFDDFRGIVMRGESMPVGNEKQAFKLMLQFHPVLQHTVVMP